MRSRAFDLVYLDLGGTVVELIAYEGAAIDPAPQTEHLGYRMIARDALTEEVRFERELPAGGRGFELTVPPHTFESA